MRERERKGEGKRERERERERERYPCSARIVVYDIKNLKCREKIMGTL